jgi:hypothetical protein
VRYQHGLGTLQVRIRRHHRIPSTLCLLDKPLHPCREMPEQNLAAKANVQAQVGGNLLVAAASAVQLQAKIADRLDQLHLDEMMDVLRIRCHGLRRVRLLARLMGRWDETRSNCVQTFHCRGVFSLRKNSGRLQRTRVRLAGGYLFLK